MPCVSLACGRRANVEQADVAAGEYSIARNDGGPVAIAEELSSVAAFVTEKALIIAIKRYMTTIYNKQRYLTLLILTYHMLLLLRG